MKLANLITALAATALLTPAPRPLPFTHRVLDSEDYGVRAIGDIDGDGFNDIVVVSHRAGQSLAWYRYPKWERREVVRMDSYPDYKLYRADDVELADIDGDGDLDIVGRMGTPKQEGVACWWENPGRAGGTWQRHTVGETDYAKEISVADFNRDGKPDVAYRAHRVLYVFLNKGADRWARVEVPIRALDGMETGDIDRDGDPDVVLNGYWLETPADPERDAWVEHIIDPKWFSANTPNWRDNNSKVEVGDFNRDGLLDVLISSAEDKGYPVSWYEAPADPRSGKWKEHVIARIDYCHSLRAADFDNDGDLDVVAAELPSYDAPYPVTLFLNRGDGLQWTAQQLSDLGSYSIAIGDLGNDGDIDVVGSRSFNRGPLEIWENRVADHKLSLDRFTYIAADESRTRRPDKKAGPGWWFGLAMGDMTGDGYADIVSGRWFYRNPGGDMTGAWRRVAMHESADAVLIVDVDGDELPDAIAVDYPAVYWLEARDRACAAWRATRIATLPATKHKNSQGYMLAQLIPGGKPEIVLAAGDGNYMLVIPPNPEAGEWPKIKITAEETGEGIAAGDFNRDGYLDIAAGRANDYVAWWENPGPRGGEWKIHKIGKTVFRADRCAVADINGDGRLDIVISEERYPGPDPDATLWWFEHPKETNAPEWPRHKIVTEYSLNSMDVGDIDRDGDPDIVVGEQRGPLLRLQIWENDGKGQFRVHEIDRGKENHLGARLFDLNGDGALDIVGIAWVNFPYLHVWRNDALRTHDVRLENASLRLRYGRAGDGKDKMIELFSKEDNRVVGEFDSRHSPTNTNFFTLKTARVENGVAWLDFGTRRQNVRLLEDQAVVEIDYHTLDRNRHTHDRGGRKGTYAIHGAREWLEIRKRHEPGDELYPLYEKSYYRAEWAAPGPLSYLGWMVLGVAWPEGGGYGLLLPAEKVVWLKLMGRTGGFERIMKGPYKAYYFHVPQGDGEAVLQRGRELAARLH